MVPPLEVLKASLFSGPVVYLIHFHQPLKHARHYVGSTQDLAQRIQTHRSAGSDAAAIMRAVHRAGIDWSLARVWSFETMALAREFEYGFKKNGHSCKRSRNAKEQCPTCRPVALAQARERMFRLRADRKRDRDQHEGGILAVAKSP